MENPWVGSPKDIADRLEERCTERACDGGGGPTYLPSTFEEFVWLVIPELQRRGVYRKEYAGTTLRTLLANREPHGLASAQVLMGHTSGPTPKTRGDPCDYSNVYWRTCTLSRNPSTRCSYLSRAVDDSTILDAQTIRHRLSLFSRLGACPRNAKIGVWGGSKTPPRSPIVDSGAF